LLSGGFWKVSGDNIRLDKGKRKNKVTEERKDMEKAYDLKKPEFENQLVAQENWPLIPEGKYKAQCIKCQEGYSHRNSLKLFLHFLICDGEYIDTRLFMAMNLMDRKTGKKFKKVPRGSNYYKNWVIANNNNLPARGDRMPLNVFRNHIFEVQVATVKPPYPDGKTEMPECFHYSKVAYLIRKEA
jgi:hypothetical protein